MVRIKKLDTSEITDEANTKDSKADLGFCSIYKLRSLVFSWWGAIKKRTAASTQRSMWQINYHSDLGPSKMVTKTYDRISMLILRCVDNTYSYKRCKHLAISRLVSWWFTVKLTHKYICLPFPRVVYLHHMYCQRSYMYLQKWMQDKRSSVAIRASAIVSCWRMQPRKQVLHMKSQSNQVSDFREFVCSLFPKAILFYFYFTLL